MFNTDGAGSSAADKALVAFSLGPVQPFIAAAQSLRDLWTGSYLLSWLSAHALSVVIKGHGYEAVVSPDVGQSPLMKFLCDGSSVSDPEALLTPCLPNRAIVQVPRVEAEEIGQQMVSACCTEWLEIARNVRSKLTEKLNGHGPSWARNWDAQIESFFEMRTAVLPLADCTPDVCKRLLGKDWHGSDAWARQRELLGRLLAAKRMVRHVPRYKAAPDENGAWPQKCSLMGTYEQMGPSRTEDSRRFWEGFEKIVVEGTRTRKHERLCAISLVKRFAWPTHIAPRLSQHPRKRRLPDTATVAACDWLQEAEIRPDDWWDNGSWNGQWLHWDRADADPDEERVPDELWSQIRRARRQLGAPPSYFAVLVADGDRMGERFRKADREAAQRISKKLSGFAVNAVPQIVRTEHGGVVVYSGGDDVLALLSTAQGLQCAKDVSDQFNGLKDPGDADWTVSAGLAVVHCKEDLRFALEQARNAESEAKQMGRDMLVLRVCRRSGGHESVPIPWRLVDRFQLLVTWFQKGASDRWAYQFNAILPGLQELPREAWQLELRHLISRTEGPFREELRDWSQSVMPDYLDALGETNPRTERPRRSEKEAAIGFGMLCSAASFMARGRASS